MTYSIGDDPPDRGDIEVQRLREYTAPQEFSSCSESSAQCLELAAPEPPPRARKRRKPVTPLLVLSAVVVTTVATLALGYLSVDARLSYVTSDTAGISVETVSIDTGKTSAPLTYDLKERDTGTSRSSGVVPSGDSLLPFTGLVAGTRYSLDVYDGTRMVRSFQFQTPGTTDMADLLGDWYWVSTVGSTTYPQTYHVRAQDMRTGLFSGTDTGAGGTFTFTGRIVGTSFVIDTDGGSYHSTARGVVSGTPPNRVMTGTFTDSNNAVGTFTANFVVP